MHLSTSNQVAKFTVSLHHDRLLPCDIRTIETIGGGSVRCMLGEVFLPEIGG